MELYDQIRKISFIFFLAVGLAHFLAGLLYVNGYYSPASGIINRVLFIPFVVATLTYAFANLKHHLLEYGKNGKVWDYTFITIGVIIFAALLAIELLVPDSKTPLGL